MSCFIGCWTDSSGNLLSMRIWFISSIKCRTMCTTLSSSASLLLLVCSPISRIVYPIFDKFQMAAVPLFAIGLRRASTNAPFILFFSLHVVLCAENLEKLAFELSRIPQPDESAETGIDQERPGPERFMGLIAGNEVTSHHQRFLMVLSNAGFCNSHLLPELSRKYQHVWSYAG